MIAEFLSYSKTRQRNRSTCTRWFIHLTIHKSSLRLLKFFWFNK